MSVPADKKPDEKKKVSPEAEALEQATADIDQDPDLAEGDEEDDLDEGELARKDNSNDDYLGEENK